MAVVQEEQTVSQLQLNGYMTDEIIPYLLKEIGGQKKVEQAAAGFSLLFGEKRYPKEQVAGFYHKVLEYGARQIVQQTAEFPPDGEPKFEIGRATTALAAIEFSADTFPYERKVIGSNVKPYRQDKKEWTEKVLETKGGSFNGHYLELCEEGKDLYIALQAYEFWFTHGPTDLVTLTDLVNGREQQNMGSAGKVVDALNFMLQKATPDSWKKRRNWLRANLKLADHQLEFFMPRSE